MRLDVSAGFRAEPGTYVVDLPNVSDQAYASIEQYFVPRISQTGMMARVAIAEGFTFALQTCPRENPSDLWHHVLYRIYVRHKTGANPNQSWVRALRGATS